MTVSIRLHAISRSFTTGAITLLVLKRIDLEIHAGELTLVMGPSGSGKSTLLSVASGLLRPTSGTVDVLGTRIWDLSEEEIARFRLENCGFIFQGFNLFSALPALDQVILPLQFAGIRGIEAERRASAALERVGLKERMHLRPIELSGGEKQRVAIARAFVKETKLLFADEPTSALDRDNGMIVIDILRGLAREKGATVFCVTHDPRLVDHADRVIRIEDGCITSDAREIQSLSRNAAAC